MADTELDAIRRELAEIQHNLADTPDDDFKRRWELRSRQQDLRKRAASVIEQIPDDRARLERQLAALEAQRSAAWDQRVGGDRVGGGGGEVGGAIGGYELAELNQAISSAQRIDELDARVAALRQRLEALDVRPGDPPA